MSVPTTPVRRSRHSSALARPPSAPFSLSHQPPPASPAPSTRARTRSGGLASLEHNVGLSVSHELELGSDEEEEEEDGGRSFKLRPLGKTLEQDEDSKTSSPGRTARLDAEERGELDRLRGIVLSRQNSDSISPNASPSVVQPPSFERSEFETIVRRLKIRTAPGSLKKTAKKERMDALLSERDDEWEFAGWGSVSYIPLPPPPPPPLLPSTTTPPPTTADKPLLGQFRATSIAGNAVFGSVFYSLPAIVVQGRTFSALSMGVACSVLCLWRGVMVELGGAVRLNGGNYVYLLNVGGKGLGLFGAAMTLLDVVATGTVSAGTAAAYIEGEWTGMPFRPLVLGILILVVFTALLLVGVRDSTTMTLSICLFHLTTMALLILLTSITLIQTGPGLLRVNWAYDRSFWVGDAGSGGMVGSIWKGVCVGFLGVTGLECMPTFVEEVRPDAYSKAIRNLLIGAFLLNVPLLLLLSLSLDPSVLYSSSNLLSLLAETSNFAPRFLKILVVVDAVTVLCGGVLCGGVACCALVERLSSDGVLPFWVGKKVRWIKGVAVGGVVVYLGLCILFYASAGFSLSTLSNIFSISFTSMMLLYALSSFLLHLNLPHLPIVPPFTHVSLPHILLAGALGLALLIGNTIIAPVPLGLTAAYSFGIFALLWVGEQHLAGMLKAFVWMVDQTEGWRSPFSRGKGKKGEDKEEETEEGKGRGRLRRVLRKSLVRAVRRSKRRTICAWVKDDEISSLIQIVLYTLKNEQTSRLVLIHAYEAVGDIPSELQANARLLDEAFPALTIDLKFVAGSFSPAIVEAVSETLEVPLSRHFIGCPSAEMGDLGAFGGVRVMVLSPK